MAKNDDSETNQRLKELEEKVEELEGSNGRFAGVRWDAVAIVAIWLAVAVMSFSPAGTTHFNEIVGSGVAGTFIVALFF